MAMTSSPRAKLHPDHSGGLPPHGPNVRFAEPDGLALLRHQDEVVLPVGEERGDELIALPEVDGGQPERAES
jgi:hypothetical protein